MEGSRGVIVIASALHLCRNLLSAHGQLELTLSHYDVSRIKPGRLTPLPPVHAHRPLVRIKRGLVKFIPHGIKPHPTGLVLLVRKRQDLADSLGPFGKRALKRPLLDGLLVEGVGPGYNDWGTNQGGNQNWAQQECE